MHALSLSAEDHHQEVDPVHSAHRADPAATSSFYTRGGKRALDVTLASLAVVVTLPVQATVAAMVRRKLGRPALFRQVRPGRFGEPFEILKFRTMTDARAPDGSLLPDEDRLTPFGQFLRSTSLDELPELYNVIRGDMSLVGPRPLLMRYLDRYTPQQARRHEVRPGITGLAQVNGRNEISWEEKFDLDVEYVDRSSLALDLKVLGRTILSVLRRTGISTEGHATAPEFGVETVARGVGSQNGDVSSNSQAVPVPQQQ